MLYVSEGGGLKSGVVLLKFTFRLDEALRSDSDPIIVGGYQLMVLKISPVAPRRLGFWSTIPCEKVRFT